MTLRVKPVVHRANCLGLAVLIGLLVGISCDAKADELNPLAPLDTSSPRATLQSVIETVDQSYVELKNILQEYGESGRLYPTSKERQRQIDNVRRGAVAVRALDVSGVSPVLKDIVPVERLIQLKEILDRIKLPNFADIPDQEAMARLGSKRWRLPGTEIDLVLVQNGERAGEYLVSAETVDRLPEFYAKVEDMPYKPGPARQFIEVYRTLSSGRVHTIYEGLLSSPAGLALIVPPRWMLDMPDWARVRVAGVTAWQWAGLGLGLLAGALVILGGYRVARRLTGDSEDASDSRWRTLPVPLAILLVAALVLPLFQALLRIGGSARVVIVYVQTGAVYLSVAWLAVIASIILGEIIVASDHLKSRSLDSQLVRLGTRLVGTMVAAIILIQGADELGFPAYSVLAGLGVGGLAVALAARDTIANLIGSLLITL